MQLCLNIAPIACAILNCGLLMYTPQIWYAQGFEAREAAIDEITETCSGPSGCNIAYTVVGASMFFKDADRVCAVW